MGDQVVMTIGTPHPGVIIAKGSKRVVNMMTPAVNGFSTAAISNSLVENSHWMPVGNWSRGTPRNGLFMEKTLQILNSFEIQR